MKKLIGLALVLMMSVAQAAQPIQRNLAPANAACDKKTDGYLKEVFSTKDGAPARILLLCSGGQWKELPSLVIWAEGMSILDQGTGCMYQINKTRNGLETALVSDPKGCGK